MTVQQTTRGIRRLAAYGVVALTLGAGQARAQPTATGIDPEACADRNAPQDPEAARVAFRAGQTAFSEGAYARAVELWDQAYRDDCTAHALLLNLAMAQELLGQPDDAIHTLTLFNRRSPNSPYVESNQKRIARLERAGADARRERARRERAAWAPAASPRPAGDGFELLLPVVVSATGAAVAVVGAALFVEGRTSASSADERCGVSRQACDEVGGVVDGERARARAEVGGWMAGAGLVTAAGGLVWHWLSGTERPMDQPAASGLSLSTQMPRAAGIEWTARF